FCSFDAGLLPSARRAGGDGVSRAHAEEDWFLLCHLRTVQERMARRASLLGGCIRKARSLARCAASSGASRSLIVHHARRAEQVARRADAKSI
ncbi:hypothetical protein A2U01_0056573, partial [Trifolium medium]|nr:hypothetical protein [Trifolium medium]